mmetsp:Transcript_16578/g.36129  ORF Transcript_16578/g.36129 Transcript_16578/m.36129 type:complete len:323 (-) Transcript_16578:17-985(-)
MKDVLRQLVASVFGAVNGFFDDVPLSREERIRHSRYVGLCAWMEDNKVNRSAAPEPFTLIADGDRFALLTTKGTGQLVLVHRGTFDFAEKLADVESQFVRPKMIKDVPVNPSFWRSYEEFRLAQNKFIHAIMANSSNPSINTSLGLHIAGHSLGGATAQMAMVDLSGSVNVTELVLAATPRAVALHSRFDFGRTDKTCKAYFKLMSGKVVRYNRATTGASDAVTYNIIGLCDPVGAAPMTLPVGGVFSDWGHCANVHVRINSREMTSRFTGIMLTDPNFPLPYLRNTLIDMVEWVEGRLMPWHLVKYYVEGIRKSVLFPPEH